MSALAAMAAPIALAAVDAPVGIDVLVTDAHGRVVTDLQPGEVTIQEDGVGRSLTALRPPDAEMPRMFGIFLDEYHVGAASTADVRRAVGGFLERELTPVDRAVVLKPLDSLTAIRLMSDRQALEADVASFNGRLGNFTAKTPFEATFLARAPAIVDQTRTQVSWAAVGALAEALGRTGEGRKTLVVVAEGIGPLARGRGARSSGPESVARLANRGSVAVYALDPTGRDARAAAPPDGSGAEAWSAAEPLARLAEETSGRALRGDLDAGLRAAAADARAYYWASYDSTNDGDGRFHRVSISVSRKGTSVRARPGYWARSAATERLLAEAAEPLPPSPLAEPYHASPLINPWFGFARGPGGSTRVTFVWEPSPRAAAVRLRSRPVAPPPSRIALEALGPDGSPIFEGDVLPVEPGNETVGAERAVFDAPPGRLRLRMSVLSGPGNPGGDAELDRDIRTISVRALDGAVTMGSAEVLRAWTALDWRRLVDDPDAPPSPSREFRRTERLLIRFPVYANGAVTVGAKLLGPDSGVLRSLKVDNGPGGPGTFQIGLPLASFAPGDYSVEITATAPAGQARDRLPFRVTY